MTTETDDCSPDNIEDFLLNSGMILRKTKQGMIPCTPHSEYCSRKYENLAYASESPEMKQVMKKNYD